MIKYDDFLAVEIRVGNILESNIHPKADKLLILKVKFGEEVRQIVAGIRSHYSSPESLVGEQATFVVNLEPREIRGESSNGMILAVSDDSGALALLVPDKNIASGSRVG